MSAGVDKFIRKASDGRYMPASLLRHIYPYWMSFDPNVGTLPFIVPASGSAIKSTNFAPPNNAATGINNVFGTPVEVQQFIFADSIAPTASAAFTLFLNGFSGRNWMNFPHHIRAVCGTAKTPAKLYEPMFLMSSENIGCQFNKISGGAVTMRMYMSGIQYHADSAPVGSMEREFLNKRLSRWSERRKNVYPYWMTTDQTVSLSANGTSQFVNKISNCHLELFTLTAIATGNFGLEIVEVVSGQTIMNGQVTQTNSIGDANFPTIFPVSYMVQDGSRLRFTLTDLSGGINQVFLTLAGRKIVGVPFKDVKDVLKDTAVEDIVTAADKFNLMPVEKFGVLA